MVQPETFYSIVSPIRNEERDLEKTIRSVAAQTVLPRQWILVNDGSTDRTDQLAREAARQYPWLEVVSLEDRGHRMQGTGVIEAFYRGYERLDPGPWQFLVKLDGDLSFAPDYFEKCFARFAAEPTLGIGGGTVCLLRDGRPQPECPEDVRFHVRGATKIYRRACWEHIGGLLRAPGWDTLDELKAQMLGWNTTTFPEVTLIHHRPTGSADGSWKNWFKNGRANYITGYHPLFMAFKCLRRLRYPPPLLASLGLWSGFFTGYIMRIPRINDPDLIRFLRRQQINRLLFRPSLWNS